MDLQQMRYFLEVAETQHVTRSAEKLHIAQPALTQTIHRLEKELGVPLFLPKGRGIVLTDYGRYLKKRLQPILQEIEELPEQLRIMAALQQSTIHLNVLAASSLMTEAIIAYQSHHTDIRFQLMQNRESELYDIGITTKMFYQFPPDDDDSQFLCTERIYLAVPNNERFRGINSIRLSDMKNEGFISLLGSRQLRLICDKFCQHAGFEPKVIFESDNPATVRDMIAAKMGVGFWPQFSWGRIHSDNIRLLNIEEPVCQRDLLLTLKRNKGNCEHVEDFFRFLKEYFSQAAAK